MHNFSCILFSHCPCRSSLGHGEGKEGMEGGERCVCVCVCVCTCVALLPGSIPSFSMLHTKRGYVCVCGSVCTYVCICVCMVSVWWRIEYQNKFIMYRIHTKVSWISPAVFRGQVPIWTTNRKTNRCESTMSCICFLLILHILSLSLSLPIPSPGFSWGSSW